MGQPIAGWLGLQTNEQRYLQSIVWRDESSTARHAWSASYEHGSRNIQKIRYGRSVFVAPYIKLSRHVEFRNRLGRNQRSRGTRVCYRELSHFGCVRLDSSRDFETAI